jgi:HD-GYP domain-containing protein (c-di-GMP phosphodiesterase class II)
VSTRAGAVEERELQSGARDFLFAFYAALRALMLYPVENQAVQNGLHELDEAARALLEREGALVLRYVDELCFLNDVRLRIDLTSYATFSTIARTLQRHGIGELNVEGAPERAEWTAVLTLLLGEPDAEDPYGRTVEQLERSGVRHLAFGPAIERATDAAQDDQAREQAKRTFSHSVAVVRDVMHGVRIGRGVGLRRVKRAVQLIVDQVLTNEMSILGMTALRDFDEYTFTHSVNVCIFSVALGKKLGLDRRQLYELGLGALLHDIGKLRMPWDVINKPGKLDDHEWQIMREHPTEGLLTLFGMRGSTEMPLRAMLMAYEHHMKLDQSGYPTSVRPREPRLFSRIVAIADGFDAATSRRSYQSQPWPPDEVLREMYENPQRGFDPLLVKAFVSMTGIYPVGCLVILDSYELAVVVAPNRAPGTLHRPIVRIIYDALGVALDPPLTVDLAEPAPAGGEPQRTIIKTTDPEKYGIDVSDYFL